MAKRRQLSLVRPVGPRFEPPPQAEVRFVPCPACGGPMRQGATLCGKCWTLVPAATAQVLHARTDGWAGRWERFRQAVGAGKRPEEIWL